MAKLALNNSELHIDHARRFTSERVRLPAKTGLLYPGPDSRLLEELDESERPDGLVILDGTWHHAKYLYRDVPWLRELPKYALRPARPSRYRIRKEPAAHCVSTIEAVVLALSALEPDLAGTDQLLRSFDGMIDKQIASRDACHNARSKRPRTQRLGAAVRTLHASPDRLVFVYAETLGADRSANGHKALRGSGRLLSLTAQRAGNSAVFAALAEPRETLSDPHLAFLGLSRHQLRAAQPSGQLAQSFEEFAEADDIFVAWNQSTLDLLPHALRRNQTVLMKAAYLNERRFRGALNQIVQHEQLGGQQRVYLDALQESVKSRGLAGTRALSRLADLKCVVDLLERVHRAKSQPSP